MARESRLKKCSGWTRCVTSCLCCRHNDIQRFEHHPTISADPAVSDQNPRTDLPSCSGWTRCVTSCLCCRHNDIQQFEHHPTISADPAVSDQIPRTDLPSSSGNTHAPAEPPPVDLETDLNRKPHTDLPSSSGNTHPPADPPPFVNLDTTPEELNKFLDDITQLCESRLEHTPSSKVSRLSSKWDEYKQSATSFMAGLPKDFTNEVEETGSSLFLPLLTRLLGGIGQLHWMAAGCSLIGWSLDMIHTAGENEESCLQLLRRIVPLLKYTKELMQATGDHVKELHDIIEKAFRCVVICTSMMGRCYISQLLKAKPIQELINDLNKDVDRALQEIATIGVVQINVDSARRIPRQLTYAHDDGIVGGDEVKRKAMARLTSDCRERVAVCLHGMGGVGKSTLGKSIFVEFQQMKSPQGTRIYRCCRVELRLGIEDGELPKIQKQILDILCGHNTFEFLGTDDGKQLLETELKKIREPVFLYLDNVLKESHLSKLLPEVQYFPEGSRILVTTRYEYVGKDIGSLNLTDYEYELIEVKKLDKRLARELLRSQLKRGNREPLNAEGAEWGAMEALEEELLGLCDGLPLALKVVGAYIASRGPRDANVWKRVIEKMKATEPLHGEAVDELYSRLRFSIDDLHEQTKKAFLDVVAFAVGRPWVEAEYMVSPGQLLNLREHALVEERRTGSGFYHEDPVIDEEMHRVVGVHDVLKGMGLQMVAADDEIRITSQHALDDTTSQSALEKVVGLSYVTVEAQRLQQMPRLRFLLHVKIEGECQTAKLTYLTVAAVIGSATSRPFDISGCRVLKVLIWWGVDDALDLEVLP